MHRVRRVLLLTVSLRLMLRRRHRARHLLRLLTTTLTATPAAVTVRHDQPATKSRIRLTTGSGQDPLTHLAQNRVVPHVCSIPDVVAGSQTKRIHSFRVSISTTRQERRQFPTSPDMWGSSPPAVVQAQPPATCTAHARLSPPARQHPNMTPTPRGHPKITHQNTTRGAHPPLRQASQNPPTPQPPKRPIGQVTTGPQRQTRAQQERR